MRETWSEDKGGSVGAVDVAPPKSQDRSGNLPTSLRGFIDRLSDAGRLVRVEKKTPWKFELGRVTRESKTPLLFESIQDYPGWRVFTNGLRDLGSIAMALGLESGISREDLVAEVRRRAANPIPPRIVASSPVLENVFRGSEVDLLTLPVPHWNQDDCGRYLGTWHINVTKDPESGTQNVGVYRMQLLGPNRATVSTAPESHLARHVAKAERDGRALPMAVAIGVGESVVAAAAAAYPYGMDEYGLAGGLRQQGVELIRCRSANLEVPAHAEIVIEGLIHPGVRVQDGPYFDYTGTINTNPGAFLFEATQLMFRNDPIFRGTSIGVPGAEDHQLFAVLAELTLLDFHRSGVKKHIQDMVLKQRLLRWTCPSL
jgi:UbiD family decarboxylase